MMEWSIILGKKNIQNSRMKIMIQIEIIGRTTIELDCKILEDQTWKITVNGL